MWCEGEKGCSHCSVRGGECGVRGREGGCGERERGREGVV